MKDTSLPLIAFVALFTACGSENKPPAHAAAPPPVKAAPAPVAPIETPPPKPASARIVVAEDILKACGLAESKAYFDSNSAELRHQDRTFLTELSGCFTAGPLKERQLRLVGHADPRGSDEYNYLLGERRAESVKLAMSNLGTPSGQLSTASRGKQEAVGQDEAGWAKDRRVEATLVQ